MPLTAQQLHTLMVVERSASALSVVGVAVIIITFCLRPEFRNPMHRLIFINAFFNIFDVTATMISLSGPAAGNTSALCQFQGFLMQSFPIADVLWTLAMAINVFLIVFHHYEASDLRRLEKRYFAAISALVFIPAIAFLFIHTPLKGPMYASVTIWCSVAPNWVLFRMIFFYGPIWFIIAVVVLIYSLVGIRILAQKRALQAQSYESVSFDTVISTDMNGQCVEEVDTNFRSNSSNSSTAPIRHFKVHVGRQGKTISFRQYILLPLLFFLISLSVWTALTVNRIHSFIDPHYTSYPLYLAVGSTGSLRGFWNGVVFMGLGWRERKRESELRVVRGMEMR